uniref:Uncharacterized protein n=1 Tax=Globisporangium ultimum (strain ATCC 200006 / CBS 805.95 / DAOM BR144) TaxID=431595 RepID=K3W5G1_GLOUD
MFAPLNASDSFANSTSAVVIGSGRFVRCVLVPVLRSIGSGVVLAQPRGHDFADACAQAQGKYEVDTYEADGSVTTTTVELEGVGSLGSEAGRAAFMELPSKLPQLRYIGFAVTDSGIVKNSQVIKDLGEFLFRAFQAIPENVLSIINTDNVPNNGDAIKRFVLESDWSGKPVDMTAFVNYLSSKVHFHNTMVDRLTTYRPGNHLVPLTEPWPTKTVVIEDLHAVLDANAFVAHRGVHIRTSKADFEKDILLKLCVLNGTHSAVIYLMALLRMRKNQDIVKMPILREFVDLIFEKDILPSMVARGVSKEVTQQAFDEWMARVENGGVALDNLWIAMDTMFRYRVRLFSCIQANVAHDPSYRPSVFMAFATAAVLRFLTPVQTDSRKETAAPIFVGEMDPIQDKTPIYSETEKTWTYGNGMTANLSTGKYEFNDGVGGRVATLLARASKDVFQASKSSSNTFTKSENAEPSSEVSAGVGVAVATALSTVSGFDLSKDVYASFAVDVAALYQRLISGKKTGSGSALDVLKDILRNQQTSEYLNTKEELAVYVRESVATVEAIDVHTHLFPPSHGKLMLWGINELLTYHYLVAEYMMTAPIEIEEFNTFSKEKQAGLIWQHLFVDRSPISEACRGVITTIQALGLGHLLAKRDLAAIQRWFALQDPEEYVDTVFRLSGLKYAVMTNIPFEPEEARHWLGDPANSIPPPKWSRKYFRSALRVDQILLGDWASIGPTLDVFQLPHTLEGCRELLVKWIDIMKPEYFMSSVPIHFEYPSDNAPPTPAGDKPTGADLLLKVLLPLAEEAKLPIALKFDSVRPINARLGVAGDGVKPCDVDILIKLCRRFPNVKFLATFLSRVNQHEVTVAANKFRNLHLYGCWWYCNNPSIIEEMTRMRIEILGTGFTSQHSDARVLDQLIYKWSHSRELIGEVLVDMYDKMFNTGWKISKSDIQRDVQRLFGLSYEEFMSK